jgi:hypothetical protein
LGLNPCRIQTVCLIYRQRLDCLPSSFLSFWLLAVSHRSCAVFYSRSSFSVPRFQFLVFRFRVPRSSFSLSSFLALRSIPRRYCHCRFLRLSRLLVFRPLASCLSLPLLDVLTFTSS